MLRKNKATCVQKLAALGILAATASGASAQRTERFDNWIFEQDRDLALISTTNTSGSVFGYACHRTTNECVFIYAPDRLNCTEGVKYSLLVNTGTSTTGRSSVCKLLQSESLKFAQVFENTENLIDQMFKAGPSVGIARGNRDGGFTTSRFEMRGFQDAFARVNRRQASGGDHILDGRQSLPEGSFQQTCTRVRMMGDTLSADCRDVRGMYRETTLQRAFNCKVGIENIDGVLTCGLR